MAWIGNGPWITTHVLAEQREVPGCGLRCRVNAQLLGQQPTAANVCAQHLGVHGAPRTLHVDLHLGGLTRLVEPCAAHGPPETAKWNLVQLRGTAR